MDLSLSCSWGFLWWSMLSKTVSVRHDIYIDKAFIYSIKLLIQIF